ncbi:MAG: diguanylate cyclase [Acidobacteriota bacterium]|nr:diguanylate cyclase [Acidobacteriota bacterium]
MAEEAERMEVASAGSHAAEPGEHAERAFSCAMTAVVLARVRGLMGELGVRRLLERASSDRGAEYLEDVGNWVGFEEAIALLDAGEAITCDRAFARHAGEDGIKVLGGTATATVLRSLGSVEEHLRRLNVSAQRWSSAAQLEAVEVRPGYAELRAIASPGLARSAQHCDWTIGMLTLTTALFGLAPAQVEHTSCQALGAPDCRYHLTWDTVGSAGDDSAQVTMLRQQLDSLSQRLEGVFATAADLISTGDLDDTLRRIADRAAQQVRAPKYLLAVRPMSDGETVCHHKGLNMDEARAVAARVFEGGELPEHWCAAEIRSRHREYGRLVAMYEEGARFLPKERELLELYARYAATALDSATALLEARTNRDEAQRRHEEANALLELARHLASAGTSDEIAARLAETVPVVIDCDRVSVWLWDEAAGENVCRAVNSTGHGDEAAGSKRSRPSDLPQLASWLEQPDPEPYFIDMARSPLRHELEAVGVSAAVSVPIATGERFLGSLMVTVRDRPERLADTPELRDRLSGVAAHAIIALENGRLVDHITYQARHDQLTGLANRLAFGEHMAAATERTGDHSKPFALFYVDLDRFKPVNDEFGHEVGDELLRAVAQRLYSFARPDDTVARLGGDEFAVIVEAIDDEAQLGPIAARFQKAFEEPFTVDDHRLTVGASIGRAVWPVDATDVEGLLREADTAMYRVKHAHAGSGGRDERARAGAPERSRGLPAQTDQEPVASAGSPSRAA